MTKAVQETAALAHVALDEVERLRAKVTSLERERDEAKAGARTPGTVEVCEKIKVIGAGQLEQCTAYPKHPHLWENCAEWDCPLRGGIYGKQAAPVRAHSPAAMEAGT